ncbi:MAG: acetyl-CoA carboxylase carboxyltransferase subunit alpha [Sedimentisphaerales bacterium]|nr:acetyl-CoA carboxylase carboxyltransferase subunit alpha [Sedimentisphaerales bacterium]
MADAKNSGNSISKSEYLDFEDKIANIDRQITELGKLSCAKGIDYSSEIRQLERQKVAELRQLYSNLTAWQTVQVARHPKRPLLEDYINLIVRDFRQLHGDRRFGDDKAIVTGLGRIRREKVLIVGQNKGRTTKDKIACSFGCPNPEGYRKAILKMKFAEKFDIPVVTFIDTPGAYPGIGAEERGQAQAIAENLFEMSQLRIPIICICIGEGGSGGALAIGVGDRMAMLEFAYFSVISPEGCAAILWRDGSKAPSAAEALKLTSKDLIKLNLIDTIITEPVGGAQRNIHDTVYNVEDYIVRTLRELRRENTDKLLEDRYRKLRSMGSATVSSISVKSKAAQERIKEAVTAIGKRPQPTRV